MQQCCQNQVNLNVKLTTGQDPASDTRAINSRQKKEDATRVEAPWRICTHPSPHYPSEVRTSNQISAIPTDGALRGGHSQSLTEKPNEYENWNFSTDDDGGEVVQPIRFWWFWTKNILKNQILILYRYWTRLLWSCWVSYHTAHHPFRCRICSVSGLKKLNLN